MTEFSLFTVSLLIVTGLIAGVINTLAGGGSNLTIPALMVMGLPADIANATNRVGVLLQSVAGVRGFHRHGKLDPRHTPPVLVEETKQDGGEETWIYYNTTKFSGKRLVVKPGQSFQSVDKGVYNVLVVRR